VPPDVTLRCATFLVVALAAGSPAVAAQPASGRSGAELYGAACAACHGADGRGTSPTLLGFDTPVPDFTDCSFSTVEPDGDWMAVSHDGGPARAFNRRMPSFGDALTDAELQRVLDFIRGSAAIPRGRAASSTCRDRS
jgi:mono/diheme cytochrome c family protein